MTSSLRLLIGLLLLAVMLVGCSDGKCESYDLHGPVIVDCPTATPRK